MAWTDDIPGIKSIRVNGGPTLPSRRKLHFRGGVRGHDDTVAGETVLTVGQDLLWITPTTVVGDVDNWSPVDTSDPTKTLNLATDIRASAVAIAAEITGIAKAESPDGFVSLKRLWNIGDALITLKHNDEDSMGGTDRYRRFSCPGGADLEIGPGECRMLLWDDRYNLVRAF